MKSQITTAIELGCSMGIRLYMPVSDLFARQGWDHSHCKPRASENRLSLNVASSAWFIRSAFALFWAAAICVDSRCSGVTVPVSNRAA